jgi:hypothetical protein
MIPPFHITGAVGFPLDVASRPFRPLAGSGTLTLRSLGADELAFSMRADGSMPCPAADQPITLRDDNGAAVFQGFITRKRWIHSRKAWQIIATGPYQALAETELLGSDGRPYVAYPPQDWRLTVADILRLAAAAGVPIQPPATLPAAHPMPKMAFRSARLAEALERLAAMVPDLATCMDYATSPPTLRFFTRTDSLPVLLDMDASGHGVKDPDLAEVPADRALAIAFAYCRRDGNSVVHYLLQSAGDDAAEARRKVSVFLSGPERTDLFVTESMSTAQKAVATAIAAVEAVGADVEAAAATAQLPLTFATCLDRDTTLQTANAVLPLGMWEGGGTYSLYDGIAWPPGSTAGISLQSYATAALTLRDSGGAQATGWYPVREDAFTAEQLATAGATQETRYIRGQLVGLHDVDGHAGLHALPTHPTLGGYTDDYVLSSEVAPDYWRHYHFYEVNIAVDAINMAPSAVAAAVTAAASTGDSALVERAEFVEAPEGLAAFWFGRQNWPHYRGSMKVISRRRYLPMPGDFISICGDGAPAEWATMANPVSETAIALDSGDADVRIGPAARMDAGSILDRLWVPAADNSEAG